MYVCTFCHIERSLVAKGPGVCICEPCLEEIGTTSAPAEDRPCSFCNKSERRSWFRFRDRRIVGAGVSGDVRICSVCVPIARGVIVHERKIAERTRS
jgi:hypothetical protein